MNQEEKMNELCQNVNALIFETAKDGSISFTRIVGAVFGNVASLIICSAPSPLVGMKLIFDFLSFSTTSYLRAEESENVSQETK